MTGNGRDSANGPRLAVGLMSGTSVDGIDAAVISIEDGEQSCERPKVKLLAFENTPYPAQVREAIFALFDPGHATVDRVGKMNVRLGELYAQAALSAISAAGLRPEDIGVIGSHGQTIYHSPEPALEDGFELRYTVQIGEGSVIAARTGIPCVSDFRPADMAAGGQGAPLVPFTEYLLYREPDRTLLLQNIGGIGNMTVIPAGATPGQVYAFDTGPGNVLIDGAVSRLYPGRKMDAGGELARSGTVHAGLLDQLKHEPYYRKPPPKSTGRELFDSKYMTKLLRCGRENQISSNDLIATVTELTAWSIGESYRRFVRDRNPADAIVVGGGGSYNPVLMERIKQEMEPMGVRVMTQEDIGLNSDAKEAVAFALLADYAIARRSNHLPSVTGAGQERILGKISY
ncbi:anhydro-N-acetylmuramic acid kinase [Cohnella panacarvi]|uniref:anhydro-N-acetylmuramic acid kinase n=1 Tax=Cohnella panacarvi TaxID=400776 RepID=UPI000479B62C|nr:anhydro-N-acetylmuramic acid kinase [Cohnella panacarvi]